MDFFGHHACIIPKRHFISLGKTSWLEFNQKKHLLYIWIQLKKPASHHVWVDHWRILLVPNRCTRGSETGPTVYRRPARTLDGAGGQELLCRAQNWMEAQPQSQERVTVRFCWLGITAHEQSWPTDECVYIIRWSQSKTYSVGDPDIVHCGTNIWGQRFQMLWRYARSIIVWLVSTTPQWNFTNLMCWWMSLLSIF